MGAVGACLDFTVFVAGDAALVMFVPFVDMATLVVGRDDGLERAAEGLSGYRRMPGSGIDGGAICGPLGHGCIHGAERHQPRGRDDQAVAAGTHDDHGGFLDAVLGRDGVAELEQALVCCYQRDHRRCSHRIDMRRQ